MLFFRKLLNKDPLIDLNEVLVNLGFLADAEERIAEFYRQCACAMPKDADLWNTLADQELQHAENVRKMIGRITRDPKLFKPGVSFSTVMIRMFIMEMQRFIEQIKAGRISQGELFAIALEIEDSTVEVCYRKIVKTEDMVFNRLAAQNDDDSSGHKSAIASRMNAFSSARAPDDRLHADG